MAAAIRLGSCGFKVSVYEKLPNCGGRNNLLEDQGFKFDMGPSFVLMPDFFEELFQSCGKSLPDYLNFKALDLHYKIFYPDEDSLVVYNDPIKTKEALEKIEPGAALAYDKFIIATARIYQAVRPILYKCFSPAALLNPNYWSLAARIKAFESYWALAHKFFKSDKLCYAMTFEAMFMGVSPRQAPAFYSVISYADHMQKIFHPIGGMYEIPLALERLARDFGVEFHYNAPVKRVRRQKGSIRLELSDRTIVADIAVANADYAYTQDVLLGRKLVDYKYSCSVYLIYLGLKKKIRGLVHHNLFFSNDLDKNLDQIFKDKVIPIEPSFYAHVPTVTDPSLACQGKDIVYILVPVPNLKGLKDDISRHEQRLRKIVFEKISAVIGDNLEDLIEVEHRFYPQDFIDRYNIKYGATFGLAHNLMQSAFFRPVNYDHSIKGMYFVGASTQPGGGLPVVIASSRIVADMISQVK